MFGKTISKIKTRLTLALFMTLGTLGQTIDVSQMTNLITSMIPLIIALISIAIPLIFIKYIMKFLEKILGGFGD